MRSHRSSEWAVRLAVGANLGFATVGLIGVSPFMLCRVANAEATERATWTWKWCSQDGEKVVQVTGASGQNFYQIKIDGEKAIRITEDEIDGGSGVLPGSRPHYGEDGHSDGFEYQGRIFRPCD